MIKLNSRLEYDYAVSRGFCPLADWRKFQMPIGLRLSIQKELFGAADFQLENQKFYKWVWDHSIQNCAETGQPLYNYSAVFISHIISRGSNRSMAIDARNVNILCFDMHRKWESDKNTELNIYRINQIVIEILKEDYK